MHLLLTACSTASFDTDETVFESGIDSISSQYRVIEQIDGKTYLEFDGGTIICVQKDAFLDLQGNPVNSNVKVELKEVQSLDEFVEGRISTSSGGKPLSTSGSYYIGATTVSGDTLSLNREVGMNVSFPTLSKDSDVKLFTGKLTDKGDVDWIPTNTKETKLPLPLPQPPKSPKGLDDQFEIQQAASFLQQIDNYYSKSGDFYLHDTAPDNHMKWSAKYVDDVKAWYAFKEKQLSAYNKLERKYAKARQKYLKKMQEYIDRNGLESINSTAEIKSYEYFIDQLGWYNCDKFMNDELVAFKGTVEGAAANVRVHLLSYREKVHITNVSDEHGAFVFNFPKDIPFEIYAVASGASFRKQYDGSETNLKNLVLTKTKP